MNTRNSSATAPHKTQRSGRRYRRSGKKRRRSNWITLGVLLRAGHRSAANRADSTTARSYAIQHGAFVKVSTGSLTSPQRHLSDSAPAPRRELMASSQASVKLSVEPSATGGCEPVMRGPWPEGRVSSGEKVRRQEPERGRHADGQLNCSLYPMAHVSYGKAVRGTPIAYHAAVKRLRLPRGSRRRLHRRAERADTSWQRPRRQEAPSTYYVCTTPDHNQDPGVVCPGIAGRVVF